MATNKCVWKKSQSSSGYYQTGKNNFINFRRNDNGSYDVELRRGLGHPSKYKVIAKGSNKAIALKKARAYMKKENRC